MRPTLKKFCVEDAPYMNVREAWYTLQTIRRWHERGHAARANVILRSFKNSAGIGQIARLTFYQT